MVAVHCKLTHAWGRILVISPSCAAVTAKQRNAVDDKMPDSWTCYYLRLSSLRHLLCDILNTQRRVCVVPCRPWHMSECLHCNMLYEPHLMHSWIIFTVQDNLVKCQMSVSWRCNIPLCLSSKLDIFLQEVADPVRFLLYTHDLLPWELTFLTHKEENTWVFTDVWFTSELKHSQGLI